MPRAARARAHARPVLPDPRGLAPIPTSLRPTAPAPTSRRLCRTCSENGLECMYPATGAMMDPASGLQTA